MLCHDGADSTLPRGRRKDSPNAGIRPHAGDTAPKKVAYRWFIALMIRRGYNVALINGLEWMDTKVGPVQRLSVIQILTRRIDNGMGG